jgi:hypothetical protein
MTNKKEALKTLKERSYLNKDFDSLRADLLQYARTYFPDQIRDFSEAGLGGLLLDMSAYVGDVQSFYLDHQFKESFPDTSVEINNIERHLKNAGVPIVGASPAVAEVTFYFKIPAIGTNGKYIPDPTALPKISAGTICNSNSGINFELTEDINFADTDNSGNLLASITVLQTDTNGNATSFVVTRDGICVSGNRSTESFQVNGFEKFKKHTLSKQDVTEVISVTDSKGNEYYEVEALTQDTVYKSILNKDEDNNLVKEKLIPASAPYRFIKTGNISSRNVTLTFGGGSADSYNDDIVPDPSQFAIPLYGKKVMTRFTLNPGNLLNTTTLGILSPNTNITIIYRSGGGLSHNVEANSIRNFSNLLISFPGNPTYQMAQYVRNSADCKNLFPANGGEDSPTVNELKDRIPNYKNSQSRIVTKEDLLARIYTMPSNFGRVFRASVSANPNNPLATRLHIISRNPSNQLVISPDALKKNLITYLNQYRMISDAIDILDSKIINIQLQFQIVADPTANKNIIMKNLMVKLRNYFDIKNFTLDQPLIISEIENNIYNTEGVVSVVSVEVNNISGIIGTKNPLIYSNEQFDIKANTIRGIVFGPPGSIFELRYKDFDILGTIL